MSRGSATRKWWMCLIAAMLALATLSGCRSIPLPGFGESETERKRALELQSLLLRYTREFTDTVEGAADEIVDSTTDLRVGRATVNWKLTTIPRIRELSRMETQGQALLAVWLYTEAMVYNLEQGPGRDLFGEAQPVAIAALRDLRKKAASLAQRVIDDEQDFLEAQEIIQDYVELYVARQPEDEPARFTSVEAEILDLTGRAGTLGWMPTFSLTTFNPFSGLNETAAAVRNFTEQADRLAEDLSSELPWRLELLLYDVEGRETVRETQETLKRVSKSAASLAESVGDWPVDVERVVDSTLNEIDTRQEDLRVTLQRAEVTLSEARALVAGLESTATNLAAAGEAWGETFRILGLGAELDTEGTKGSIKEVSTDSQARPFDILDYRDTAEELRRVALELRGLIGDFDTMASESGKDSPLGNLELAAQTAATAAADQGRELVDHIALRLIQIVGVIFLAAIFYRVVASQIRQKLGPRKTGEAS